MRKTSKKTGSLIVLEGPDGVGKSTLSSEIYNHFKGSLSEFHILSFPGKEQGTLGKLVYDLHHEPQKFDVNKITNTSNQLLHVAAHIDSIEQTIIPMLKQGNNLVLDRFWWSTWVYGVTSGVKRSFLKRMLDLEKTFWHNFKPDAVFLINRNNPIDRDVNLFEWAGLSHEYDVLAERETNEYPVFKVSNNGTISELVDVVINTINESLASKTEVADAEKTLQEGNAYQLTMNFDSESEAETSMKNVSIFVSHIHPAKPTIVFDTYWKFAVERQSIFFKKLNQSPLPLTEDPILTKHKFTNAYRASDRVSQFLIKEVIYNDDLPNTPDEIFFRIILFKLFNKIETWNLLTNALGEIRFKDYNFEIYDHILTTAMSAGKRIYSAAYIMPSGGSVLGFSVKHRNHLKLIEMMMKDELYKKLGDCPSMQKGFYLLREYPTIGDFLAYQFITDINYSEITDFSEMEFVVPGPGALDGIRKCFTDRGGLTESELIRFVADIQESEFERLGLNFQTLWGRSLQLIDCQNLFCEVDKYSRVKHPEISGITGRTRIKQIYKMKQTPIDYWYPPKWNINHKIDKIQLKSTPEKETNVNYGL